MRRNGSKERMGLGLGLGLEFCERKVGLSLMRHFLIKERELGVSELWIAASNREKMVSASAC